MTQVPWGYNTWSYHFTLLVWLGTLAEGLNNYPDRPVQYVQARLPYVDHDTMWCTGGWFRHFDLWVHQPYDQLCLYKEELLEADPSIVFLGSRRVQTQATQDAPLAPPPVIPPPATSSSISQLFPMLQSLHHGQYLLMQSLHQLSLQQQVMTP